MRMRDGARRTCRAGRPAPRSHPRLPWPDRRGRRSGASQRRDGRALRAAAPGDGAHGRGLRPGLGWPPHGDRGRRRPGPPRRAGRSESGDVGARSSPRPLGSERGERLHSRRRAGPRDGSHSEVWAGPGLGCRTTRAGSPPPTRSPRARRGTSRRPSVSSRGPSRRSIGSRRGIGTATSSPGSVEQGRVHRRNPAASCSRRPGYRCRGAGGATPPFPRPSPQGGDEP